MNEKQKAFMEELRNKLIEEGAFTFPTEPIMWKAGYLACHERAERILKDALYDIKYTDVNPWPTARAKQALAAWESPKEGG